MKPSTHGLTTTTNVHAMTSHNSMPARPGTMNEPAAYARPQEAA
jgi:hypothetical protein